MTAKAAGTKTALITGASAGIGRELAFVFAEHGHDLILVARSSDKLEDLAGEVRRRYARAVEVVAMDLGVAGAARRLYDELASRGLQVEILVNNAGVGAFKPFGETDCADITQMIQLNVMATTELTRLLVPEMVERGHGRILNLASVAAFVPTPLCSVYGATKAFVLSFTEALSEELSGRGVSVSALCPGVVDTEMVRGAGETLGHPDAVPSFLMLDPRQVAREGYQACMEGEVIHINGFTYEAVVQWMRLQPRWFVRKLIGFLARRYR
ncbi:MAG: SDR family oxidoreductase [Deltaproteobacteria bacterium]|nr:SDR family oxidoreductase [Deltaproteobacteria bacterium]